MTRSPRRPSPATPDWPRPLVTVDVVIFTVREAALQVLLVRRPEGPDEPWPGRWALPGGFVDVETDADLAACALRKLEAKTGVASPYLEQLGSWGDARRDPRGWSVTSVYFALIPAAGVRLREDAAWHTVQGDAVEPELAFDHAALLAAAVGRLRSKVEYTSLPAYLLEPEFTLTELQQVYEIVLERPLEKSAFRTRVLAAGLVEPVPRRREGACRPAQLYRLARPEEPVVFPRTFSPRRG